MIPLIILGCVLAIALFWLFLLSLKVTLTISYREKLTLIAKVLCFKIPLYPAKEKKGPHSMSAAKAERIRKKAAKKRAKKRAADEKKKAEKEAKAAEKQAGTKQKKSMAEILDTLGLVCQLASTIIRRFVKHLRIDVARLKIKVATGDAAVTAVAYGAVTQLVNVLLPILEEVKNFKLPKETDLDIQADFLSERPEADIELSFSLRVWHVLDIALHALFKFFKRKFKDLA